VSGVCFSAQHLSDAFVDNFPRKISLSARTILPRGGCWRAALSLTKKTILSQVCFAGLNRGLLSVITD
jgi:hypothetical protein